MKRFSVISLLHFGLWVGGGAKALAGVDSVVTFNEVQYHPTLGQGAGEWIELKNQNSTDVDLSGWRLDGGVDYVFPAGSVIGGGQYLVVAANPAALMAEARISGVLGPFSNSLANGGESVTLKNNNGRRMDEIAYGDQQPWPVAADGSGASLAKLDEMHDSVSPENWRASVPVGGTPGTYNFIEQLSGPAVALVGAPGVVKRYYRFEGDLLDGSGSNVTATKVGSPVFAAQYPPLVGSGQSMDFNGTSQYVNVTDTAQPTAYTIAAWVKPDVIRAQSIVLRSDASGAAASFSHQIRMTAGGYFEHFTNAGGPKAVVGTTKAVAGLWYHVAIVARNNGQMRLYVNGTEEGAAKGIGSLVATGTRWMIGSSSGGGMAYFDGLIDEVGIWQGPMDATQVGHIATRFRLPTEAALVNQALGRKVVAGSGAYPNLAYNGGAVPNDYAALRVTDGSASDVDGSSYWLGREGVSPEHFILDLGGPVAISQILLRNTHRGAANNGGTGQFRVTGSAALDASNQLVAPTALVEGTLTTRTVPVSEPPTAPVPADAFGAANGLKEATVRYVKFEALTSAYGSQVGLNEIEVFGTRESGGFSGAMLPLVINEITAEAAGAAWLELYTDGASALPLGGMVVETSGGAAYTLPSTTLAAGGFLVLDEAVTGLHPLGGEKVFLFTAAKEGVVDGGTVHAQRHRLRRPPAAGRGPGEFLASESAADRSPGAPNRIALANGIVINEIMYHRRPQFQPFADNDEEWIELYNKSDVAVDLSQWSLDEAVSWRAPAGTVLAPGAYLCLSNQAVAFALAHPGVPVLGDFSGSLSNRGERIVLRDALGNAVDEVFYRDKEPWPLFTDGLGSSLELKHPEADNASPESWAASDETARSAWQNYTFTAAAKTPIYSPTITTTGTTAFQELRMGLLEEGEVLVDDISVREITTAPAVELMQNGSFTTGTTAKWRLLGNHDLSGVVDHAGNPVLQLRASGPLFYLHNLLETTLKSGTAIVPVVNNRQYTISLRAKWLRGCPWLHTEFYYNKVAKTFLLDLPAESGTPGMQNSTYQATLGPTFSQTRHAPAVPAVGQAVTVSTLASDPQGMGAVALKYSVNGTAAFTSVPMALGTDGFYTGTIPGQVANAVTQFYVEGSDAAAVPSTAQWPPGGPASRALIKVNEGAAAGNKQNLRVITTTADANALASSLNIMSNRRRGCTIVHNEKEIFYNSKIRLRGSMYSRGNLGTSGESLTFPADHLFRGTQRTVSARIGGIEEIVVKHAINAAGGLPDNYNDIIQLISFRSDIRGPARLEMERFSNSWLDEFYPEGSEGTQFKMEGIRFPTLTVANGTIPAGNAEGFKDFTTNGMSWVGNLDIADLGADPEQYRHSFRWLNNFSRNDNARFVQMCRAMSLPTSTALQAAAFESAIEPLMDVNEWMRCFAMMSLFGINDAYTQGNPHNINFYMPPTADGKISAIPWDWNFVFSLATNAPLSGDSNLQKVISRPRFKRLFLGHLKHIIDTTFNSGYMTPWLANYGSLAGVSYSAYTSNINSRRTYVLSQINSQVPPVAFSISTNAGADFAADGSQVVLEGKGWVDVAEIRLGQSPESLPVEWLNQNSWRIKVPLSGGSNALAFTAYDRRGVAVGSDSIGITNTSTTVQASAANTVISEIHYHPAAGGSEFLEIMNISAVNRIDLTGCGFSVGLDYAFAAGTVVEPGARLVIAAAGFLSGTALSNGGDRVRLEGPGGVVIRDFVYGDKAPWPTAPDGEGPSLVLIAPLTNPDHGQPQNWRASTASGGNPGGSDHVPFTGDAAGDADGDGWSNLLEYALGPNPVAAASESGFTVPRIANADDAEILGEVSPDLGSWSPAVFLGSSATSLTFGVPEELAGRPQVFFRAKVRLR